jgi:hypothetical protein
LKKILKLPPEHKVTSSQGLRFSGRMWKSAS